MASFHGVSLQRLLNNRGSGAPDTISSHCDWRSFPIPAELRQQRLMGTFFCHGGGEGTSQLPFFTVGQEVGNVSAFAAGYGPPPHFWPVNAIQLPHDSLL